MDNLTHTLTGLLLSRAGLNRYYAHSGLLLMIAANIPDIDIVAASRGSFAYFEQHRGITHSIAMVPVIALVSVLVVCAIHRSMRGWKAAWVLAIIGVASHLLLDWTNAYGIRFFFPFSSRWFHLDLNNLVELWIWAVFLLACLAPLLGRLVSSEMGARPASGRGLAIFALVFVLAFDFGKGLSHQRAIEILNSRVYQGGPPIRAAAFPNTLANPFEWSGWVERPEFDVHFASLNVRSDFDPAAGTVIFKPAPNPAIDAAREAFQVEKFLEFSQYPLWRVTPLAEPQGGQLVEVRDWRFPFTVSATVDSLNRVLGTSFHY